MEEEEEKKEEEDGGGRKEEKGRGGRETAAEAAAVVAAVGKEGKEEGRKASQCLAFQSPSDGGKVLHLLEKRREILGGIPFGCLVLQGHFLYGVLQKLG